MPRFSGLYLSKIISTRATISLKDFSRHENPDLATGQSHGPFFSRNANGGDKALILLAP
ncbi:MAG: hypothetical protein H0A75_01485 [Candidatus Methanofishera endochildressiae]|uniref:Uncharacterized protein n=1 Tax=Candidatus Methanofishera endochildressiae TaxID=2738884 RepID=A0A7Z0SDC7_9GAMM|nr:hypothetical protein [Candidatus Methanofishera endochildressiae]